MPAQAQAEAKALIDTVKEAAAVSSVHDVLAAMRQDVADLQRAHEEDALGLASGVAENGTLAPLRTDELRGSATLSIKAQLDDGMGQATVMSQRATEVGISELRTHLNRLSNTVPAVQRLQTGDRVHSM